jgi:glycosyltransferase involved in cell wall biosynthesis
MVFMRILFVTSRFPTEATPGDSPCIDQQRTALQSLGHKVDLLYINSQQSKFNYLKAVLQLIWMTQITNRYDIVHAHYGSYCGMVACLQRRTPIVITFRGDDVLDQRERSMSQRVARLASAVIVMTDQLKETLGRDDAHIIPYGIDLEVFRPCPQAEARRMLGLPSDLPLVLFPYNPERTPKRFDLILQAVDLLKGEFPDLRVVAVHDKPHATVATYMNACDVLALASESEGAPVAVREAMACNLPVVSVDVGDVAKVIGATEGCYLVKREPGDISKKLAQVLKTRVRTNGWLAAQKINVSQAAVDVAGVYETVVRKGSTHRQVHFKSYSVD